MNASHNCQSQSCPSSKMTTVSEGRSLSVLCLVLVLDLLAFTAILPLFPAIFDHYAKVSPPGSLYWRLSDSLARFSTLIGAPHGGRLSNVFYAGLLGAMFSALQFASSPVVGALSDVFGRKRVLAAAVLGSLASYSLWLMSATSFPLFMLSRCVGGLCKASVTVATAVAADVTPVGRRGRAMALIGVCFSLAFLVGPAMGAYMAGGVREEVGQPFAAPAGFAIVLTVIELALIVTVMPETLPKERRRASMQHVWRHAADYILPTRLFRYEPLSNVIDPTRLGLMQNYGRIYFIYLFLYSGLEFTLTFLTHLRFNFDSARQGRLYVVAGLVMILVQGGLVRRLGAGARKQLMCALIGMCACVPGFALIATAHGTGQFYAGLVMYAFASGTVVPCLTTLVADLSGGDAHRGAALGVLRSQGALARAMGPALAAVVFWMGGATICYLSGALALLLPTSMLFMLYAKSKGQESGIFNTPSDGMKSR